MGSRLLIGWREFADFPEWGLSRVKVKVDTGARTSALHAHVVEATRSTVRLQLLLYRRHPGRVLEVTMPLAGRVRVRNTGGHAQERFVVETELDLGPIRKRVRLTVADRSRMLTPVILGRQALADDFVVDAGRKFLVKGGGEMVDV
jgi:hypothetical protein